MPQKEMILRAGLCAPLSSTELTYQSALVRRYFDLISTAWMILI
jgi:hypothetical protein